MDVKSHKILVLSDMKDSKNSTIKSAVSLSKMIHGNLHVFHVKKPTEIVEKESQLSAMRNINKAFVAIKREMSDLIKPIAENYKVDIGFNHAVGNLKSEILNCITSHKPDIIVLGKRKAKPFKLLGDGVTDLVIDNFDGAILIATEDKGLIPEGNVSLGVLNNRGETLNMRFSEQLLEHSKKPIKNFKTQKDVNENNNIDGAVSLVFDNGRNSISSISNYLTKLDVNLLCLNRKTTESSKEKVDRRSVINQVNVSVLLSERQT